MLRTTHGKSIVSVSIAFLILASLLVVCGISFGDAPPVSMAPPNPRFADWLAGGGGRRPLQRTECGHPLGLIPRPVDLSHTQGRRVMLSGRSVALPEHYDLREHNKLTPVRDQGDCGSCWSFATYGSLESCLMPSENRDFSENNLINLSGFDPGPCDGGTDLMALAYLARWSGPLNESDDPYDFGPSPTDIPARKHVQEALFIPDRTGPLDNEHLKQAVMTYGAIYTGVYYSDSCFNSSTNAYYYNGDDSTNHAVCIVGWDNSFDRRKFASAPPGNGAFIIRNSWGTIFGEKGYFYVSYYDSNVGRLNTVFDDAEPTTNYKSVYQYDPLGWTASLGLGDYVAFFANVFRAGSDEILTAVSFYSASPDASYAINVYTDPTSGPINAAGPVTTQTGDVGFGYFTIPLDIPVALSSGQGFSVVVRLIAPGTRYPIPAESPIPDYSSQAVAEPGQGYISSDGVLWQDVTDYFRNTSVCLKAFTSAFRRVSTPSFSPDGGRYDSARNVRINCSTSGVEIRYTTDGTDPTTDSTIYSGPMVVDRSLTLKAKAWKSGYAPSNVKSADYAIGSNPPYNKSLSPDHGWIPVDAKVGLRCVYGDDGGYASLARCYLLINNTLSTARAVHVKYDFEQNRLYVRNDDDTAWLGGYAPGSSRTIENSYCRLYCADTYISASGTQLAVNWSVMVKSEISGNSCHAWMKVFDRRDQRAGWDQMGSFDLARPPKNVNVTPASGTISTGKETPFASCYSDPNGVADISLCYLTISPSLNAPLMAALRYDAAADLLYLYDPSTGQWRGGYHPKSQRSIENSYCRLHCESTSIFKTPSNLTVKWRLEFKKPMSGKTCGEWMTVIDKESLSVGPNKKGTVKTK